MSLHIMGQLIGPLVQLLVAELLVLIDHRQGLRRPFHLSLEQLMDAGILGKVDPGGVPLGQ